MNINEIRYFERKMINSACKEAIEHTPSEKDRIMSARKVKLQGLISFSEYITYLQDITGNCPMFFKYRF